MIGGLIVVRDEHTKWSTDENGNLAYGFFDSERHRFHLRLSGAMLGIPLLEFRRRGFTKNYLTLTREQVRELLPMFMHFSETGKFFPGMFIGERDNDKNKKS